MLAGRSCERLHPTNASTASPLSAWRHILFSSRAEKVPSFSVQAIWVQHQMPEHARLVDFSGGSPLPASPFRSVLELDGASLSMKNGLVLFAPTERSSSLAVVDVAGGCCRKRHAFSYKRAAPMRDIPDMLGFASAPAERHEASRMQQQQAQDQNRQQGGLGRRAKGASSLHSGALDLHGKGAPGWGTLVRSFAKQPDLYPEHDVLYHAISSRSTTFYHALATSAPKLILALPLLRRNHSIVILVSGPIMPSAARAFGLDPARLFVWWGSSVGETLAVRARRLLIPTGLEELPKSLPTARLMMIALRQEARALMVKHATSRRYDELRGEYILVVRREAFRGHSLDYCLRKGYRPPCGHPGRAFLNHNELLDALRRVFPDRKVVDFSPDPRPVEEQVRLWSGAAFVLAPHGAGLTNLLFLPPHAYILELRAQGRKGAVYHGLGATVNTRHEECIFNDTNVANGAALRRNGPDMNVVLPVPYVFGCMRNRFADLRPQSHRASGLQGLSKDSADAVSQSVITSPANRPLFTADVWARIDALAAAPWSPRPPDPCDPQKQVRMFGVCVVALPAAKTSGNRTRMLGRVAQLKNKKKEARRRPQ